ncbi:MAG: hypothetical protein WBP38_12050, partial [Hyphomicrobium sp.]
MTFQQLVRRYWNLRGPGCALAVIVLAAPLTVAAGTAEAADTSWPSSVAAKYKLYFGGFEVGSYR